MPTLSPSRRATTPVARRIVALSLAVLSLALLPASHAQAVTATDAEGLLLRMVNNARVDRGLVPLVRWAAVGGVARQRATTMARTNTLSHTASGNLSNQLDAAGVRRFRYGEVIAYTGVSGWNEAARSLFRAWRGSAPHWRLLMSDDMNYFGAGLALRTSNGRTFGSIVLTESPDHTGARAWMTTKARSGDDVRWTWTGRDARLQTHTAGLRDFDVQYRVDGGAWRLIRDNTTSRSISLADRVHQHTYSLRVRATDRRGNVGAWSNPSKIWVP